MFWSSEEEMRGHLVVVDTTELVHIDRHYAETIFVCVNCTSEQLEGFSNECIQINNGESVQNVFNELLKVFDTFNEWQSKLESAVNEFFSFEAILRSCEGIVDDPIALLDAHFKYVGYMKRMSHDAGLVDLYVGTGNSLPLEEINRLTALPDFNDLETLKDTFEYVGAEHMIHKNIFYHNDFVGRLAIPYSTDKYKSAYHAEILRIIAHYIEMLYNKLGSFWHRKPSDTVLKKALINLINGNHVEKKALQNALANRGNNQHDRFVLVQIKSHFMDNESKLGNVLITHLESLWAGACCFVYLEHIVVLINLSFYEKATQRHFSQDLAYFLRESLFLAGVSRSFTDISSVQAAYKQTDIALQLGPHHDPMFWYFKFDDYAYWHVLHHGCGEFLPEQICHTAIETLKEYDVKKQH